MNGTPRSRRSRCYEAIEVKCTESQWLTYDAEVKRTKPST
jgi:hypothetical protein